MTVHLLLYHLWNFIDGIQSETTLSLLTIKFLRLPCLFNFYKQIALKLENQNSNNHTASVDFHAVFLNHTTFAVGKSRLETPVSGCLSANPVHIKTGFCKTDELSVTVSDVQKESSARHLCNRHTK